MKKFFIIFISSLLILSVFSCQSIPKGATAVSPFELDQYLGKWYEIARIDFFFEKNLNNTTAEYSLLPNGNVKVTNRGYHIKKEKWKQANGKAKFRNSEDIGELKVSFFGPFYAGYNVLALEENYKYALVAGKDEDLLWILSREPTIPENIKNQFLEKAKSIGYDTSRLIWVEHNRHYYE